MGICPILFNMLQFWLIDSIVKAKQQIDSFGTPMPHPVDDVEAPLFSNDQHEGDTDDEDTPAATRRRRDTSRELGRGVSPLNLSAAGSINEEAALKHTEPVPPPKTVASTSNQAGLSTTATLRSPPSSPAHGATGPKEEDDWSGWDEEPDWDSNEAGEPWSKQNTQSPKAAPRRKSSSRTRSERGERTSWGMDVINTPGAVR